MRYFLILSSLIFCFLSSPLYSQSWEGVYKTPAETDAGMPVYLKVPKSFFSNSDGESIYLTVAESKNNLPVQRDGAYLVWQLPESLPAGASLEYRLGLKPSSDQVNENSPSVQVKSHDGVIEVSVRGRKVFRYREAVVEPPEGMDARYRRSGYLHPVWTPSGKVVTGDFAEDHPHQHGVFFAWTNTKFQGRAVNFWDQVKGQGRIEHREVISLTSGPVFGELVVKLAHVDLTPRKPIDVLEEVWRLRVYNTPTDSPTGFLIDFQSEQTCVADEPLKIQQYHYGGMAIRGNTHWLKSGTADFLTNEGKTRKAGNHSRPVWCDLHGELEGTEAGFTMISAMSNFRFPQPVRLHPKKPYFCWAPLVVGPFEIAPNETYNSVFRFWVHDGEIVPEAINQLQQNFEVRLTAQ